MKTAFIKMMFVFGLGLYAISGRSTGELIGYWKMDEDQGEVVRDRLGFSHGKTSMEIPRRSAAGRYGKAIAFDGKNESGIVISNEPLFDFSKQITVSAWVKQYPNGPSDQYIISKGVWAWMLMSNIDRHTVEFRCTGLPLLRIECDLQDDQWHHIVGVYDGRKVYLYADGKLLKSIATQQSQSIMINDIPVMIGTLAKDGVGMEYVEKLSGWNGLIDEVAIFDQGLTTSEVDTLFKNGPNEFINPQQNAIIQIYNRGQSYFEKQNYSEAVSYLQNNISSCESNITQEFNGTKGNYQRYISELYYLLAQAKGKAGLPKSDVIAAILKHLNFEQRLYNHSAEALYWLYENTDPEIYRGIMTPFGKQFHTFECVGLKGDVLLQEKAIDNAVKYLQDSIKAYEQNIRNIAPLESVRGEKTHKMYFQYAEALRATNTSTDEIASAYQNVFYPGGENMMERIIALWWLLDNNRSSEIEQAIKIMLKANNAGWPVWLTTIHYNQKEKNLKSLDTLYCEIISQANDLLFWGKFIKSCQTGGFSWSDRYSTDQAMNNRTQQMKNKINILIIQECIDLGKYDRAEYLCEDTLRKCNNIELKEWLLFQRCQIPYEKQEYTKAMKLLDDFVNSRQINNATLIEDALLLKGCSLCKMGKFDEAMAHYQDMQQKYPQTKKNEDILFFIGYCNLLMEKYETASNYFRRVTEDYPKGAYAEKASVYLSRIAAITRQ
jgi:tetratricopeptide (TPR) repeat protein